MDDFNPNAPRNNTNFGLLANNLKKSNPKIGQPNASNPNFGVINQKKSTVTALPGLSESCLG